MSIKAAYDSWAEQYDSNANKTRDMDREVTQTVLAKYDFEQVLELGCGTGKNTEWFLSRALSVTGVDFSKEMLTKARLKFPQVQFIKADITQHWEMKSNWADLVTCNLVLEHVFDLNHVFKEANRVLMEEGILFISELHPFKQYLGSGARFESEKGTVELEVYTHHISEFVSEAQKNSFTLVEINEWFDEDDSKKPPRLVTFVFRKECHYHQRFAIR